MTTVRLPSLAGGKASVQLVTWDLPRVPVLGFVGPEWATTYDSLDLTTALIIPLTPTSEIGLAGGGSSCYLVQVTAPGGRSWRYPIRVPDSGDALELASLVGAEEVAAGTIAGAYLLPATANIGDSVVYTADGWASTAVAPGAGVPEAPLTGGPFVRRGGAWEAQAAGATDLSIANAGVATLDIASSTGADATIPAATASAAGLATAAQISKLDGIAAGATTAGAAGDAYAASHEADTSAHPAANITVDASGFNGNLATTDNTVQKVAQKVDDLVASGGVSDHGALTGLSDDDHSQYHTDARGDARYSLTSHAHTGTYDPAGTAAAAVSAHAGAADPHTGYALESSLGGAALLSVGTTTGTVAAGDDSRLSNARTPTAHAASHATGQADAISAGGIGAEPSLGNPGTTGYVLSSTTAGVRSWVAQSAGGGVDTANSPAANEFARFTDADTIEGRTVAETMADLGAQKALTRVSATITTAALTATVNAHHVLTISGMTAERSFVIPSGTAEGDLVSWELITAAPATTGYELVLIGDTGITLTLGGTDRTATADGAFRYLLPGETGVLRYDATAAKWRLIHDGRKPTSAKMSRANAQTVSSGAWAKISLDTSVTETGGMNSTGNGRITIRRAGSYFASPFGSLGVMVDQRRLGVAVYKNGSTYLQFPIIGISFVSTGTFSNGGMSIEPTGAAGDYYELWMYQDTGTDKDTGTTANSPTLTLVEKIN